jgi:DNA-binding MarR family transcriptional regulator
VKIDIRDPVFLSRSEPDAQLDRTVMALWYFAHRDATADADAQLAKLGLNRTHFRALFFINLATDITLNELLPILQISHQGGSRVVGELIRNGYVDQVTGTRDRRQRHLRLTAKGQRLERQIVASQTDMMKQSERVCGSDIAQSFRQFLVGLLSPEDYAALHRMLTAAADDIREHSKKADVRKLRHTSQDDAAASRASRSRRQVAGG